MRLVSFDDYRPGLLQNGSVYDLSQLIDSRLDWDQRAQALIAAFETSRPAVERAATAGGRTLGDVRLNSPIPRPRKVLCELGDYNETIPEPKGATDFYLKSPETISAPGGPIALPAASGGPFRARGAVATVIGRTARNVAAADAAAHIFGFTPFIDAGTEAFGRPNIGTFFGNSFDGFGPMGPAVVTAEEIGDPSSLSIRLSVNGTLVQDYSLSSLHYALAEQIEAASAIMTLRPGDVIVSGKFAHDAPALKSGDSLTLEIGGLGELRTAIQ